MGILVPSKICFPFQAMHNTKELMGLKERDTDKSYGITYRQFNFVKIKN